MSMKEIILKVLKEVGVRKAEREVVATKLHEELNKYVSRLIEDIVTPQKPFAHPITEK